MPTPDDAKRVWEGARVRGELDAYLLPLRERYQAERVKLDHWLLRKTLTPTEWSQLQTRQGRIAALAEAIWALDQLSKPEPYLAPSKRRKAEE